jgi:hypothetical protein
MLYHWQTLIYGSEPVHLWSGQVRVGRGGNPEWSFGVFEIQVGVGSVGLERSHP